MNIKELIIDSEEILEKIDSDLEKIRLRAISKAINVTVSDLVEFFETENIIVENNPNATISVDLLKQVLLKEPETSSPPLQLRELILNSDKFLIKLNSDKEFIRVGEICRTLGIGVRKLTELLGADGIVIEKNPNYKVSSALLKQLIVPKVTVTKDDVAETLEELEKKINQTEEKEYVKSVVLRQFLRSEQIREYAKVRAKGQCELCENPAPFNDKYGRPFLETHHIIYLSKGGKDTIDNVAAICPNCHRRIHNLRLTSDVDKLLSIRK